MHRSRIHFPPTPIDLPRQESRRAGRSMALVDVDNIVLSREEELFDPWQGVDLLDQVSDLCPEVDLSYAVVSRGIYRALATVGGSPYFRYSQWNWRVVEHNKPDAADHVLIDCAVAASRGGPLSGIYLSSVTTSLQFWRNWLQFILFCLPSIEGSPEPCDIGHRAASAPTNSFSQQQPAADNSIDTMTNDSAQHDNRQPRPSNRALRGPITHIRQHHQRKNGE
jgi:hypothetical protein